MLYVYLHLLTFPNIWLLSFHDLAAAILQSLNLYCRLPAAAGFRCHFIAVLSILIRCRTHIARRWLSSQAMQSPLLTCSARSLISSLPRVQH